VNFGGWNFFLTPSFGAPKIELNEGWVRIGPWTIGQINIFNKIYD